MGCFFRLPSLACWWCGSWGWWCLLILCELWAGERLTLEKAHPRYLRPGRPISMSAVPFVLVIDIWRTCRFIGASMRSPCLLPGGHGRFVPCSVGANHCRLRHIGWEKCGHGLTSRLRESASEAFLHELLLLFQYPPKSSRALLAGTLSGTVLPGLLVGFLLGGCRCLGTLLIWFMQVLVLRVIMELRWVMRVFTGLVVLVMV